MNCFTFSLEFFVGVSVLDRFSYSAELLVSCWQTWTLMLSFLLLAKELLQRWIPYRIGSDDGTIISHDVTIHAHISCIEALSASTCREFCRLNDRASDNQLNKLLFAELLVILRRWIAFIWNSLFRPEKNPEKFRRDRCRRQPRSELPHGHWKSHHLSFQFITTFRPDPRTPILHNTELKLFKFFNAVLSLV
jgi:hypothetical protein